MIATENGWNLYVGGNGGFTPRHADLLAEDLDANDYEDRIFPDPAELPGTAENERREEQDPGAASRR